MNIQDPQVPGQEYETIGTWRLTYAPGPWVALAGPAALVVVPPAPARAEEFLTRVWEAIVPTTSIDDLVAELGSLGVTEMPDMAALFWDAGSMHSLVRGRLQVVDADTDEVIASGEGVRTWTEVGLGDVRRVRIDALGEAPVAPDALYLPLVVGAATVGSLLVETTPDRLLGVPPAPPRSATVPPVPPVPPATAEPDDELSRTGMLAPMVPAPEGSEAALAEGIGQPYDPMHPESDEAWQGPRAEEPRTASIPAVEGDSWEEPQAWDEGDAGPATEMMAPADLPEPSGAGRPADAESGDEPRLQGAGPAEPPPVLALLRPITGAPVTVDRPVLIGRAPSSERAGGGAIPKLMTVPSPSHDISRTHLKVEPVDRTVQVTDLNSTNGTVLVTGPIGGDPSLAGQRHQLVPGEPVAVQPGWILDLGDGVTILIDRA